ncbi:MAG: hypothetical protein KGI26_04830 [Thaumarchaeota archaeon]|nr:hypothetical protein [Nitrososphaerota archaeon]
MGLLGMSGRTVTARDFREPKDRPKLWDPDERDFNLVLNPKIFLGDTGRGKTVASAFLLTELYDNPPSCIGGRPKIIMFDIAGRSELACAFAPMRPENPLFKYLTRQRNELPNGEEEVFTEPDGTEHPGVNPKGYKVEVRIPLQWALGRPDLEYSQPAIVKPYVIAIDDLKDWDWVEMLGLSEDHSASYLHKRVLENGSKEGWLKTATLERLGMEAERVAGSKRHGKRTFTQKQVQALSGPYGRLGSERLVMPKRPSWDDERELPWLDMKAMLEDVDTITVLPLDFAASKSQAAHLMAVLLNKIIWLKDKNRGDRVKNAVVVAIPDISVVAAPSFDQKEDRFMGPVKDKLLWMFSKGTGSQICVVCDSQDPEDIDKAIMGKGTSVGIFKLERDKIRDIFKNMVVENKDDMLETEELRKLETAGYFIWKAAGNPEAEMMFGAIPRFEYPRHRLGTLSDFTYVDLWRLNYPRSSAPQMWQDIQPLYKLVDSVRRAGEDEWEAAKTEGVDEEGKPEEKALDFGPEGNKRVEALLTAAGTRSKMAAVSLRDLGEYLGDTIPQAANLKAAHAMKIMRKLEKRGFAHPDPESFDSKKRWTIETGRLRKAMEKAAIPEEYSEAAKRTATLGEQFKLEVLNGNEEGATKLLSELVEFAGAHKDDEKVKAVMIGFMGASLPLTPAMKEMLGRMEAA